MKGQYKIMKVKKNRGTDSLLSFTANTLERLSAKTDYDEWVDSDT
jgi:hypothetical protein